MTGTSRFRSTTSRLSFGGVHALDGVTYDVPAGQIVGIIGPNGAGKTTLFDCISGFRKPDSGSIMLTTPDGPVDLVNEQPWHRTALGVGRTFQNARLFRSLSLRDILRTVQHDSMKQLGFVPLRRRHRRRPRRRGDGAPRTPTRPSNSSACSPTPTSRRRNCRPACCACASWRR